MYKSVIFILSLIFLLFVDCRRKRPEYWDKTSGGERNDAGFCVMESEPGVFLVGGRTTLMKGFSDIYILKVNTNGDILWENTYDLSKEDVCYTVEKSLKGGYLFSGYTAGEPENSEDIYVLKTDKNGSLLWNRIYKENGNQRCFSIVELDNSEIILAGLSESSSHENNDILLMKVDSTGNLQWIKTFGEDGDDQAKSVIKTRDYGLVITGFTSSKSRGDYDILLLKTDRDGQFLWMKTYGGLYGDRGYSIIETFDGKYAITGWTESFGIGYGDVYLLKTDSKGDTLWTWTYGGSRWDAGYSIKETSEGGYIITGYTESFGNGKEDIYLMKTDINGEIEWVNTYGGIYQDIGYSVAHVEKNGYIVIGETWSFGNGYGDVYIIKMDSSGNIPENTLN